MAISLSNTKQELNEVFEFLKAGRDDVRKMAAMGLAEQSGNNGELVSLLVHEPAYIQTLMDLLSVRSASTLGDVLTIFINCGVDTTCAEAFASAKVVQRVMRLLDALEASELPPSTLPAYKEMSLMLLNNLTASHVVAIQDLLQVEDEELAGFFLGRLHVLFSRQPEEPAEGARDLRKWFMQIVLNSTRTPDGQRWVLDDDWPPTLATLLTSSDARLQYLAAQTLKNCASRPENHDAILKEASIVPNITERLHKASAPPATLMAFAELAGALLQSETGMNALEEINAKKFFSAAVVNSQKENTDESTTAPARLPADVAAFLEQHVLVYMDDIQDAIAMETD